MEKDTKNQFSIIIPIHNEEMTVKEVICGLLERHEYSEIIVVDDGSSDKTSHELGKFNIKVITHASNEGYGAALKTGIENATTDIVVTIDADGEHPAEYINSLIAEIGPYDMVVGARTKGDGLNFPWYQRIAKGFICWLLELIFRQKILDINSGLRVMKKNVVEKYLSVLPDGFSFTATITLAMLLDNHKIKYVPIGYSRRTGKSKVKVFNYTINFIKSYWRLLYQLKFVNSLSWIGREKHA